MADVTPQGPRSFPDDHSGFKFSISLPIPGVSRPVARPPAVAPDAPRREPEVEPEPLADQPAFLDEREIAGINLTFAFGAALALGLVLRLALAFIDGFAVDMGTFAAWSNRLATDHPWNFYQEQFFTDYAPGYMYVLWFLGELNQAFNFNNEEFEFILKIPAILADLASAVLLWVMVKDQKPWLRLATPVVYLFLPITLFIGALWGQVDSILAFLLLLSVYYIGRDRPVAGAVVYTIGFLVKPQAIAALPFLAFWVIRQHPPRFGPAAPGLPAPVIPRTLIHCTVVPLVVLLVLITPFFELQPWRLVEVLYDATNVENYRVNSFWAYNFWTTDGLFNLGFRCDLPSACEGDAAANATEFLGIATRCWGMLMFFTALGAVLFTLRNARGTGFLALGVALSTLAFYLFLTRMHERYVFPFFLPFLLACALLHSRVLWSIFVGMVAIHFLNLYHVFAYYYFFSEEHAQNYPDWLRVDWLHNWVEESGWISLPIIGSLDTVQVLASLFVLSFFALLPVAYVLAERRQSRVALAR